LRRGRRSACRSPCAPCVSWARLIPIAP
jgi:hypothetical protein